MESEGEKITISWDEIDKVQDTPPATPAAPQVSPPGASWGKIQPIAPSGTVAGQEHGSVLMKGWFYLGMAGLVGAFLAWAFCEPSFEDGGPRGWADVWMFPLMVILISVGFAAAESLVERSWQRAFARGAVAIGLGLVLGFFFDFVANFVYALLLPFIVNLGVQSVSNPLFWVRRGFAWGVFGMAGGLVFGIVSKSGRKTSYGMLGGVIGAAIGGLLFDPISLLTQGGEASRAIGMSILGASTGIAIGLVESALKDRWLYVASGPLAGKQFILYHDQTTIGRQQSCTIYLFKDPSILDQHAVIQHRGARTFITAYGEVAVSGQRLRPNMERVLANGETIKIGQYVFQYSEKAKTSKAA